MLVCIYNAVLMEIVNRWLLNSIGRQLSSDRLSSLYQLLHTPLPNGCYRKSITISKQHDITRVHNELRIYLRSSTSSSDDAIDAVDAVGENTSGGARGITHQPTTNEETSWSSLSNHTGDDSSDTMTIDVDVDDVEVDNNDDRNRLTSKIQFMSRGNSSSNSIKHSIDVTVKHPYNTSIDVSMQANDGDEEGDGCFYESRQDSPTDGTTSSSSISQDDAVDPSTSLLDTVDDRCDGWIDIELCVYLPVAKQPHHNIIHLELRSNRRGDQFWPMWKHHPIKLIDFVRGQKVARQHRYNFPVVSVAVTATSPSIDGMMTQTTDSNIIVACLIPTATAPAVASSSSLSSSPSSSSSLPAPMQSEEAYKVFIAKPYTNQFCRAKPVDGLSLVSDDTDTSATTASVIASSVDLPSVSRDEMVKMVLRIHMRTDPR
jgi:hypothetical protein